MFHLTQTPVIKRRIVPAQVLHRRGAREGKEGVRWWGLTFYFHLHFDLHAGFGLFRPSSLSIVYLFAGPRLIIDSVSLRIPASSRLPDLQYCRIYQQHYIATISLISINPPTI